MSLKLDLTKGTVKQDIAELPEKMLTKVLNLLRIYATDEMK